MSEQDKADAVLDGLVGDLRRFADKAVTQARERNRIEKYTKQKQAQAAELQKAFADALFGPYVGMKIRGDYGLTRTLERAFKRSGYEPDLRWNRNRGWNVHVEWDGNKFVYTLREGHDIVWQGRPPNETVEIAEAFAKKMAELLVIEEGEEGE